MKNTYFSVPVNEYYIDVMANVDAPNSFAAAYTPTFHATTNVDSVKIYGSTFSYIRTGDWVEVMGEMQIWTTNDSTATNAGITLPFASAITDKKQISGIAVNKEFWKDYGSAYIEGNIASDRAEIDLYSYAAGTGLWTVYFRYKILR